MTDSESTLASTKNLVVVAKLETHQDWPSWFRQYRSTAAVLGVWNIANPNAEPDPEQLKNYITLDEFKATYKAPPIAREAGAAPESLEAAEQRLELAYAKKLQKLTEAEYGGLGALTLYNWLSRAVSPNLLKMALDDFEEDELPNLRLIVKKLKSLVAPTDTAELTNIRARYRAALQRASQGGIKPSTWYMEWYAAYRDAKVRKISDVEGVLAAKDFLQAIQNKMAPEWARNAYQELVREEAMNLQTRTLDHYAKWFKALVDEQENQSKMGTKGHAVFATFGERQNGKTNGNNNNREAREKCPCAWFHPRWAPASCQTLRFALRGEAENGLGQRPDAERCAAIKKNLANKKYKELRATLKKQGWLLDSDQLTNSDTRPKDAPTAAYPGSTVAAILDGRLMVESNCSEAGMFATYGSNAFAISTLLDNCGATHLVNDIALLAPGSFVRTFNEFVMAGTESIPIQGRGRRVMKNVLNGAKGKNTEDLTLSNVAVIDGFHVNIISEKLLRKKGIWYSGFDCTLRFGTMESNVIVRSLTNKFNLTFFELRSTPGVFIASDTIPSSSAGMFAVPTLDFINANYEGEPQAISRRAFRPSRDPPRPRKDTAELWHARAGHLGAEYGGEHKEAQVLVIASDASFADDETTRRSSQGYIFTLFGGPILYLTRLLFTCGHSSQCVVSSYGDTANISKCRLFEHLRLFPSTLLSSCPLSLICLHVGENRPYL